MHQHMKRWSNLLVVLAVLFGITNVVVCAQPAQETPSTTMTQPQDPPLDPIHRLMDATGSGARVRTSKATGLASPASDPSLAYATLSITPTGVYAMDIPSDTYKVTACKFGYLPEIMPGVPVVSGTVTTQDSTLSAAPSYVVEGVVSDANTGWPLYASIDVSDYPGGQLWTDPVSGYYSLTLSGDYTYNLAVNAWAPGYEAASLEVFVESDATENFGLDVDVLACAAPGYQAAFDGLTEQFTSLVMPTNWTVVDNTSSGQVWTFDNPGGRDNLTGGGGGFAIVDSDYYGDGGHQDADLRTPSLDFGALSTVLLEFKYDYFSHSGSETAAVDVSANGAAGPWTRVFTRTGGSDRGPQTALLDISALAAGQSDVMVRFHYLDAYYEWWLQVDDVRVGEFLCNAPTGGLVVGNVYDGNTAAGLSGTDVSNEDGYSTTTMDKGLYTLFSPAGSRVFTATLGNYTPDAAAAIVIQSDTVRQDFILQAGMLSYTPPALKVTLPCDEASATLALTLTNDGASPAMFSIGVPVTLLDEGFEGGLMPPSGWQVVSFSASVEKWGLVDAVAYPGFCHSGDYAGWVNYDSADSQDEWLYSPSLDLTNVSNPQLAFWALSDTEYPGATMSLYAIDAGATFTDTLWDLIDGETWADWGYRQVTRDLSAYAGKTIRLAWRYHGFDGGSFGLDDIAVTGVSGLPWLSISPFAGTIPASADQVVDVTFNAGELVHGQYTTMLAIDHDTPYDVPAVPVTLTLERPNWDKTVYVNDELVEIFPASVVPSDTIEIVDEVLIPCGDYNTFGLTEEWTEALELVDHSVYALPGGTVIVPAYGTVIPAPGMLVVSVTDAPGDWSYIITKTFNVLDNGRGTDLVTETLVMDNAHSPFDPVVLGFVQNKIYLPLVVRY